MDKYVINISVPDGKVGEILDKLTEAQETIRDCYYELNQLGVLTVTENAASGN